MMISHADTVYTYPPVMARKSGVGLKTKPPGLTSGRFQILECFSNLSLCSYDLRNLL